VWTDKQLEKLAWVKDVLVELDKYAPLTLRQVYYQLVGKGLIENNVSQYTMLSNLLKWARIDGYISWDTIEDRVRTFHNANGWSSKDEFIKNELRIFLQGYKRDLLQTQDKYIEIWIEKDALSSIFTKIASPYCISTVVCRGFSSISFLHDFKKRLERNFHKEAVMLYFGDFDPSGVEMLQAMQTTLEDELGVSEVLFKRTALTQEDIETYNLPHSPTALKHTDSRSKKHIEQYGELAVELDALRPDVLEEKIKDAIEAELDMEQYKDEYNAYSQELGKLSELKNKVSQLIQGSL